MLLCTDPSQQFTPRGYKATFIRDASPVTDLPRIYLLLLQSSPGLGGPIDDLLAAQRFEVIRGSHAACTAPLLPATMETRPPRLNKGAWLVSKG